MHDAVFVVAIAWAMVLVLTLIGFATVTRSIMTRTLALEVLSLVMVAALAVVAIERNEAGYLDIALVLAMLGFAQTIATLRLVERTTGET